MLAIEMSPFWNWNLFSGWVGVGKAHKTWPHVNMRCNSQWRREPVASGHASAKRDSASACRIRAHWPNFLFGGSHPKVAEEEWILLLAWISRRNQKHRPTLTPPRLTSSFFRGQ